MTDSNLRPLTLPSLSPTLTKLSQLKSTLIALDQQRLQYIKLTNKLETFTDEPTWDAYVRLSIPTPIPDSTPYFAFCSLRSRLVH